MKLTKSPTVVLHCHTHTHTLIYTHTLLEKLDNVEARNTIVCIVPYLWGAHLDCWDNSHIKTPPHNPHHIHTFTSSRRAAFFASKAQEHGHKHSPARALIVHADHSVPFGSNSYTALIWRLLAGSFKADLQEAFYFFKGKEKPHLGDDGLKRCSRKSSIFSERKKDGGERKVVTQKIQPGTRAQV